MYVLYLNHEGLPETTRRFVVAHAVCSDRQGQLLAQREILGCRPRGIESQRTRGLATNLLETLIITETDQPGHVGYGLYAGLGAALFSISCWV